MKSSLPATISSVSEALRAVIKRRHFPIEIMLTCVRWYVAYPLSLRHIEEMMAERGVPVDHATIHRWSIKLIPVLAAVFKTRKLSVGSSWRMDETYIQVGGQWKYLYRAVDAQGQTIDFLMSAKRDAAAARRFLENAIELHGIPQKISIDGSTANKAAVLEIEVAAAKPIELRQIKYLNNLIEQDHRAIKRIVRPMLGFKSFACASIILAGIETMHMIKKGQLDKQGIAASAAEQFYSLAF